MAKGRAKETRSWKNTKTSIFLSTFSTVLPITQEPIATRTSQLARMIPRVSSFPRKKMRRSRNRMICAAIPLSPVMSKEAFKDRISISGVLALLVWFFPIRTFLTVAKKRIAVNGLKQMRVEKKDLHDEVFLDDRFVLPDFFHDSLILDHAFFQDVTPIRGLPAEFE